jgi:phage gpG-like protein
MSIVEFKGLGKQDRSKAGTFPYFIDRLIKNGGNMEDVMDDIGRTGVTLTTEKLMENKVTPKTTNATLERRRKPRRRQFKRRSIRKGTTLVDTGIGMRQVSYRASKVDVAIGVPDGYMAYHQEGRVPNAPRRAFLMLPNKKYILNLTMFHIKKVTR